MFYPMFSVPPDKAQDLQDLRDRMREFQRYSVASCLFPQCDSTDLIGAHTISKSILRRISDKDGHIIGAIRTEELIRDGSIHMDVFDKVHINQFYLFRGLCHKHDQVFQSADKIDMDTVFNKLARKEEVTETELKAAFLWNYRAVIKRAVLDYNYYHWTYKILNDISVDTYIPEIVLSPGGHIGRPILWKYKDDMSFATDGILYFQHWTNLFMAEEWDSVYYQGGRFVGKPTVAVTSIFNLDDLNRTTPAKAIITVLPSSEKTTVFVYCTLAHHAHHLDKYLRRVADLPPETDVDVDVRNLLSRQIIRDVGGIAIAPQFWKSLSSEKKKDIADLFMETIHFEPWNDPVTKYDSTDVSLFTKGPERSNC